ncbi:NAD(P)H-hydrate dehydratase [Streptacidiphilus sp. P02-A3a]|uniref:NAD(P)H-hydrate dehydratase n=1 Tax=Streptacidiphilus sp. P02-A3a TaxID=2704468 RepID=UPI0015FBBC85|nr:NAD(P)H-hydrate dehydratase [Streptacidiphilus sp. P02-A3a]QMU72701.1 NAD(P)H-hydrate dehydratase [Streptacidiphilus sp. P02-A3a]
MRYAHTVEQVRAAEAALMARLPEGTLMRRAAAGLAATCLDLLAGPEGRGPGRGGVRGRRVVLLAGSGDNGGDALFAGARLAARGVRVHAVLLAPERAHAAGLAALLAAGGAAAADRAAGEREIGRADLVLDGIVGIGGRGGLREPALPYLRAAERAGVRVVAVDLPSGVDADTGEVPGEAVTATVTVTFGTYKPGLFVDPGAGRAGVVRLVDIGLEPPAPVAEVLQHADVAALLPRPTAESDKYRRGVVGVAAGSERYPGAAVLAVSAALRGGAGAVRYAGTAAREVVRAHPETLVSDGGPKAAGRVQAWVVGPGLADGEAAERTLAEALAAGVPTLVDADGLRLLARRPGGPAPDGRLLLTPHAGEAAALLAGAGVTVTAAQVEAERLRYARLIAERYGCTVLLKGSTTVVAGPDPALPVRVNPTGTPWLATAGSGDVLSGLAGSLLASGLAPLDAASAAAYLHGLAGRIAAGGDAGYGGYGPVTASDVAAALPAAWRNVTGGRQNVLSHRTVI